MLKYRCKKHNIPLKTSVCDQCGSRDSVEVKSDIYWCSHCNVPIYDEVCHVCGTKGKRVAIIDIVQLHGSPLGFFFVK